MSVLIRGMKMPESCHECVAGYGGFCFVAPPEEDGKCPHEGRAEWCPLVDVTQSVYKEFAKRLDKYLVEEVLP